MDGFVDSGGGFTMKNVALALVGAVAAILWLVLLLASNFSGLLVGGGVLVVLQLSGPRARRRYLGRKIGALDSVPESEEVS